MTKAIGVEKFNCAYFRSDVSQILPPFLRVHPCRASVSSPLFLRTCCSSQPSTSRRSLGLRSCNIITSLLLLCFCPFAFPFGFVHIYSELTSRVIYVTIKQRVGAAAACQFNKKKGEIYKSNEGILSFETKATREDSRQ